MEINSHTYKEKLFNQIEDAYGKVVYTYTTHIIQASRIEKKNRVLKWVELILSAFSAGGFLATVITDKVVLAWIGGLCSTALLILTAYFRDVEFAQKQQLHLNVANELWSIREDYVSLMVDFELLELTDAANRRDLLKQSVESVYRKAPVTDKKSYTMAQKAIKENESQYFSRDELNQMLPEMLRK